MDKQDIKNTIMPEKNVDPGTNRSMEKEVRRRVLCCRW